MPAFDTSSIIHAWDHYPMKQFPGLWKWLSEEFRAGRFTMSEIAEAETKQRDKDCHAWLHANKVQVIPISQAILTEALKIKAALGIVNDRYHPDGVGENDLMIVATCVHGSIDLVSNENMQNELPQNRARYKIPAVCALAGVNVACINFRQLIIRSGKVF